MSLELHRGDRILFREWDDPELNRRQVVGPMRDFMGKECTVSSTTDFSGGFHIKEDDCGFFFSVGMIKAVLSDDDIELPDISTDDLNELFY